MRRATLETHLNRIEGVISIHALHEESDYHDTDQPVGQIISIHALHEESDSATLFCVSRPIDFNPRSP